MKFIPTYSDGKNTIAFFPVENIPGFTHKVVVNGSNRSLEGKMMLLAIGKPSIKTAKFFLSLCKSN